MTAVSRPTGAGELTFQQRVEQVVAAIPVGAVLSYGEIAAAIGAPRAARQVGWAMARCTHGLPWHRVINARGELSERGDGPSRVAEQRALLESEGHVFVGARLAPRSRG